MRAKLMKQGIDQGFKVSFWLCVLQFIASWFRISRVWSQNGLNWQISARNCISSPVRNSCTLRNSLCLQWMTCTTSERLRKATWTCRESKFLAILYSNIAVIRIRCTTISSRQHAKTVKLAAFLASSNLFSGFAAHFVDILQLFTTFPNDPVTGCALLSHFHINLSILSHFPLTLSILSHFHTNFVHFVCIVVSFGTRSSSLFAPPWPHSETKMLNSSAQVNCSLCICNLISVF